MIAGCAWFSSTSAQNRPETTEPPSRAGSAPSAASAASASGAPTAPAAPLSCPATPADTTHRHLIGEWTAQLGSGADAAATTLTLVQHPELAHSVRGHLQRGPLRVLLSGDVEDGDLTLEESENGTNISATWIGRVVDGRCGQEIRGTWTHPSSSRTLAFVLRKRLPAAGQW
ncbi:hypothetical protein GCM10023090_00700 [Acidovorax lacteus]|uniref:Uncharacterized protein n=1 Tax=Acidovorax lacteus TaxID=1924988 RepID=A0ABP8KV29_9BURK